MKYSVDHRRGKGQQKHRKSQPPKITGPMSIETVQSLLLTQLRFAKKNRCNYEIYQVKMRQFLQENPSRAKLFEEFLEGDVIHETFKC